MAFIADSRSAGYLGPRATPAPLEDEAWADFLAAVIVGVTDLPLDMVRPRWQAEPPNYPNKAIFTDWCAVGITGTTADWQPAIVHFPGNPSDPASMSGDGFDAFQRMETATLLCTFYGPHCNELASLMRDGLFIDQNRAALRAVNVAVVEVGDFTRTAELFRQRWLDRTDVNVIFRREVRRDYPVLNLLAAQFAFKVNRPG